MNTLVFALTMDNDKTATNIIVKIVVNHSHKEIKTR